MLEGLSKIRWERERQPSWNQTTEVPDALRALADATEETRKKAHDRVLHALGDDGTACYQPVALTAVPFLGEMLVSAPAPGRRGALAVLVDLVCAFEPAAGFEDVETPDGPKSLKSLIKAAVLEYAEPLEDLRADSMFVEESKLAADVLAKLGRAPKPGFKPIKKKVRYS